jgi:hypothetical protein
MKRFYLYIFLVLFIPLSLLSQVTRTVGTTGANYSTLKLAFDAINAGTLTGNITLQIIDNTNEVGFSASLNASGIGNANYNSVSIYPTVTGKTISGSLSNHALINLNGADNVTFDGRLNGTGSSADLTIKNTSTSAGITSTIYFANQAESNTIKYCNLKGSSTSAVSGIIFFSTAVSTPSGNNNNLIDHNNISADAAGRPVNVIFSSGTNGKSNTGNIISNNNIFNFLKPGTSSNGINISANNSQWTISDNSFYETSPSFVPAASVTYMVIYIHYGSGDGFNISGNFIGGQEALCGGSAWTKTNAFNNQFFGIYLNAGSAILNSIQGNTIKNINWSNSGAAEWTAIHLLAGAANIGTITGNTIGASSGTGSILVTGGATNSNVYGIRIATSGTVDCQNNIIGSLTAASSSITNASNIFAIYKTSSSGTTNIIGNFIGSSNTSRSINASSRSTGNVQSVIGIRNENTADITISGNSIFNLSNLTTNSGGYIAGLELSSTSGINNVNQNFIYNLLPSTSSTVTAAIIGIRIYSGFLTVANNIVHLSGNTPSVISGIHSAGTSNETYLYHNTVNIEGTPSYGSNSTAALFSNGNLNIQNFRNNIFNNARTNSGSTGKHYAVRLAGNQLTIDYNDYYVSGSGGVLGYLGGDKTTLDAWKSATGQDNNSLNTNPTFRNPGSTVVSDYKVGATLPGVDGTGITADYGLNARGTFPTMGAWENIAKWKGTVSTNWATPNNWTDLVVPTSDANIIFDLVPDNDCVLDQNRSVTDITNESGRNLLLAGKTLTIKGTLNFTGSGRINANAVGSEIIYSGSSVQTIESNQFQTDSVYKLTIANVAGVSLNSNFKISQNLTINPSCTATIEAGKFITVSGTTANNGTLNLRSTSGGTASLITGAASGTGNNIERYITGGLYHNLSSPVSGHSIQTFLTTPANNIPTKTLSVLTYGMEYYDEAQGKWIFYDANNIAGAGNFSPGVGYLTINTTNGPVTFSGSLNTGDITPLVTRSRFGWNSVGNPYTSSIGLNTGSTLTNFIDVNIPSGNMDPNYSAAYFWNDTDKSYTIINNTSPATFLNPGQGFLIKTSNGGDGFVEFFSSMQTHSNPIFYKKSSTSSWDEIVLHVNSSSKSAFTKILFRDDMSRGLDIFYDAGLFDLDTTYLLYTKLVQDNGVNFSIQCLSSIETDSMTVPIGFNSTTSGIVTFRADINSLPSGYTAILEDRFLGIFTDLNLPGASYEVAVPAEISGTRRFFLHTVSGPNRINLKKQQEIFTYAVKNEIFIKGQVSESATSSVYDVMGRLIGVYKLEPGNLNNLKLDAIKSGVYIVKVKDLGVIKTDRVFISE